MNKFDQPGPLARSVADLGLFDSAATGDFSPIPPTTLKGVRIGVSPEFFLANADAEVERIFRDALHRIEAAGARLVWAEIPEPMQRGLSISLTIQFYEIVPSMSSFLQDQGAGVTFDEVLEQISPNIDPIFKMAILPPNGVTQQAYQTALAQREQLKAAVGEYFRKNGIEVLAFPPVISPPPPLGDNGEFDIRGKKIPIIVVSGRNTAHGSCASLSCLVLPAGLTSTHLPVGVEFDAMPGADRKLLSLGLSLERALGPIPAPPI
jgi:mandelamide amidase